MEKSLLQLGLNISYCWPMIIVMSDVCVVTTSGVVGLYEAFTAVVRSVIAVGKFCLTLSVMVIVVCDAVVLALPVVIFLKPIASKLLFSVLARPVVLVLFKMVMDRVPRSSVFTGTSVVFLVLFV